VTEFERKGESKIRTVHHQNLELLLVADDEFLETVGENVPGLGVGAVTGKRRAVSFVVRRRSEDPREREKRERGPRNRAWDDLAVDNSSVPV
jgi:hypothetical protein